MTWRYRWARLRRGVAWLMAWARGARCVAVLNTATATAERACGRVAPGGLMLSDAGGAVERLPACTGHEAEWLRTGRARWRDARGQMGELQFSRRFDA